MPSAHPTPPDDDPDLLPLECSECGGALSPTDGSCSQCGRVFADEIVTHGPHPHPEDPELEEFGEEMADAERITRIVCTIAGALFGVLTIVLLVTGWALGALAFLFPTVVCLARGLGKFGADLEAVKGFRILAFLRWTPYPWWLYPKKDKDKNRGRWA